VHPKSRNERLSGCLFLRIRLVLCPRTLILIDGFYWLGIELRFYPLSPFYWTVLIDWLAIMSARAILLDSFSWKTYETDREKSFYWTILTKKLMKLSVISLLLDSSYWLTGDNVRESDSIGQF